MKILIKFFLIFLLLVFIFAFIISGCTTEEIKNTKHSFQTPAPNNTSILSNENTSDLLNDNRNRYQKELEKNLVVDAEVKSNNITKVAVLQVESEKFDLKKLCSIFFDSKNIKEEKNVTHTIYTNDNKCLVVREGNKSFSYYSTLNDFIQGGVINSRNFSEFKQQELDFMPKQKAVSMAINILKSLNITPYTPKIYAVDFETLQREQETYLNMDGIKEFIELAECKIKDKWTKEDEFYYMFFPIELNGIPCDTIGYTDQASTLPIRGSEIEVIISKNGVELCKTNGTVYQKINRLNNELLPIISMDQAINIVKKKYDDIILINQIRITEIAIVYTPILTDVSIDSKTGAVDYDGVNLIPTWLFKTESNDSEKRKFITYVRINAITGDEIL